MTVFLAATGRSPLPVRTLDPVALASARRAAGLTQMTTAAAVGRTLRQIQRIEAGAQSPTAHLLGALSVLYGCPVDAFYGAPQPA